MACPASAVLDAWPDDGGDNAARGTAVHAFLEHLPAHGLDAALAQVPAEHHDLCRRINLEELPLDKAHSREVAIALNLRTGEAQRLNITDRQYPEFGAEWIMGTLDVAGIADGRAYVADYKTGRNAKARWQLTAGALAWASLTAQDNACAEVIHIDDNGDVYRQPAIILDGFDMAGELAALRDAVESWHRMRAEGTPVVPTPGSHCKHCSSWRVCPAKVGLVRQAAGDMGVEKLEQMARAAAMVDDVPRALRIADALKEAAGRIYQQAYAIAAEVGPIQIDDTQALGYHPHSSPDELRGDMLHRVVTAELGAEVANVAVEMTATKASLKRALDKARESGTIAKGQGAATERKILAQLAELGGVVSHPPKPRMGMFRHPRALKSGTG